MSITLTAVRPVAPIPCRGQLGAWRIPADVARELDAVTAR